MAHPICPACGKDNACGMVRCGKYRAYICMKHCYNGCEYFTDFGGTSITHCVFRERMIEKRKAAELAANTVKNKA